MSTRPDAPLPSLRKDGMTQGRQTVVNVKQILFDEQRGRCATCEDEREIEHLVVDHCHETGFIRGLLCGACNRHEGVRGNDHPALVAYRSNPPGRNRWKYGEHRGVRLTVDMPAAMRWELKRFALEDGLTLRTLLISIVDSYVQKAKL